MSALSQLATPATDTAAPAATAAATAAPGAASVRQSRWESLKPLVLDAVVPTASYYLLSKGFGMGTMAALAWSSVVPAGRTLWSVVKERKVNGLAALILAANVVGLLLSLLAGDPRLMLAKDSGITATVGIAVLMSVAAGRPLMTVGLKPWVTKGNPVRTAVWERLIAERGRFARMERTFSVMWGVALFGEAVVRVVGAYTLPVDTMVWLGGVIAGVTITATVMASGRLVVDPMEKRVSAEVAALG
ncbi:MULTISPECIES: VC0807 family protein [Streptomyces]